MTKRQRLEAVINGEITEELVESCRDELAKLNERGAKMRMEMTPQKEENRVIADAILDLLNDTSTPMQVSEIMEKVTPGLERQRVTAICTNLIREGKIESVDLKVKGKGKRKGYVRV